MSTFSSLHGRQNLTAAQLMMTFKAYERDAGTIHAPDVITLIDRVTLTDDDKHQLCAIAEECIRRQKRRCQSAALRAQHVASFQEVITHLKSLTLN